MSCDQRFANGQQAWLKDGFGICCECDEKFMSYGRIEGSCMCPTCDIPKCYSCRHRQDGVDEPHDQPSRRREAVEATRLALGDTPKVD